MSLLREFTNRWKQKTQNLSKSLAYLSIIASYSEIRFYDSIQPNKSTIHL